MKSVQLQLQNFDSLKLPLNLSQQGNISNFILYIYLSFTVKEPSSIELEEWEAFLNSNISEVMDGDVESLTQLNMVSTICCFSLEINKDKLF